MKESLRSHIELLFENAPKTRRAFELKEELYANSVEKYDDLVSGGSSPEDAYKNVVNSIGNIDELFKDLEMKSADEMRAREEEIKKLAVIKTVAVGLYIFSVIIFLWSGMIGYSSFFRMDMASLGLIAMLLIDIIPTCMLVYVSSVYPKYRPLDNTVVEEFKAWKSENQKTKSLKGAIYVVIWTGTLLLYFTVSFATWAWYISWVIFLVGACITAVAELLFRLKEMK